MHSFNTNAPNDSFFMILIALPRHVIKNGLKTKIRACIRGNNSIKQQHPVDVAYSILDFSVVGTKTYT